MSDQLVPLDRNAGSVVSMLENAKSWLTNAVETTGPADIAAVKAQVVTAETYAREMRLSHDIQMDAREMIRRAEYALGKAIRKGQEDGTVETKREASARGAAIREVKHGRRDVGGDPPDVPKLRPTDLGSKDEMRSTQNGILELVDVADPEVFEAAITEARDEGNLSRANVIRKSKGESIKLVSRKAKAALIAELAEQGYSSRQMPEKVGVGEENVRRIARDFDIDIPADKSIRGSRRFDSDKIVVNTATALEGLVSGTNLVHLETLGPIDPDTMTSLKESLKKLNRFYRLLNERTTQ